MSDRKLKEAFAKAIPEYKLMDDEFFRICMRDNIPAVQLILRVILNDEKLIVLSMKTQEDMKNILGKSSLFDVHAIDKNGRHIDIEIQKASKGAGQKRVRYYSSLLDLNISNPGEDYNRLPDTIVIMIAENDVLKCNLPLYHIERYVKETGQVFNDGSYIIYVNGKYKEDNPLGRLMKDFQEKDATKIYYPELRDRIYHFKNTEEGEKSMSDELERIAKEYATREKIKAIVDMIKDKLVTFDAIKSSGKYSPSEIEQIEAALKEA